MKNNFLRLLMVLVYLLVLMSCDYEKVVNSNFHNGAYCNKDESIEFAIPFELINDRIVVRCKLNGKIDVKLAVDNACSELYLTESFAKRYKDTLNLKLYPESSSGGSFMLNPLQECYLAEGDFFYQFGDSTFINYYDKVFRVAAGKRLTGDHAMVLVENPSHKFLPDGVDGILPMRCFSKNGMVGLNFAKDRFEFDIIVDSSMTLYRCEFDDNKQIMKFPITFFSNLGDSVSYVFKTLLDLGCNREFIITNSYNNDKIINKLIALSNKNISSLYTNTPEYSTYNFKQAKIGEDHTLFKNIEFIYSRTSKKNKLFDLLIGVVIMSDYYIAFDYANNLIYMKPLPNDEDGQNALDNSILASVGLNTNRSNSGDIMSYYVVIVDNDRKNVNIQLFDTIIKIDGIEARGLTIDSIKRVMVSKHIPHKTVTIKRGDSILVLSRNK